jgi:Tol biopolymer transport system component
VPLPHNGVIAFATVGGSPQTSGIYTVSAQGGAATLLVTGGSLPAWASSDQILAYVSDAGGISAVNADGSDPRELVAGASAPAFSHDGTRLAYVKNGSVWISAPDGTRPHLLQQATGGWNATRVAWSSDDRRLAYLTDGPDSLQLLNIQLQARIVNVVGPTKRPLVVYREPQKMGVWYAEGNSLAWRPNRDQLALSMVAPNAQSSATGLISAAARGAVRRIGTDTFGASWAPDGTALCVAGQQGLAIVDSRFRTVRTLQQDSSTLSAAGNACAWQPLP